MIISARKFQLKQFTRIFSRNHGLTVQLKLNFRRNIAAFLREFRFQSSWQSNARVD